MMKRVLQVGSGSMGTRRLRDLSARGDVEIALLEMRDDRRRLATDRFGIPGFSAMESALAWNPDMMIISTPPHTHAQLVELALRQGLPFFCEAELFPYNYLEVERLSAEKRILAAPSCSLKFLPVIQQLTEIVKEQLGALHSYYFCLSVDTKNWHVGEGMEYYARNRSTNGTREMVVFELITLSHVFGVPVDVAGTVRAGGELGPNMEDTWSLQMRLNNGGTGQLVVHGGSPQMMRTGMAIGANGFIEFDLFSGKIVRNLAKLGIRDTLQCGALEDVLESVYATEIGLFVDCVCGKAEWPHDYRKASVLSGTLAAAEKSAITGQIRQVDPAFLPAQFPDQY